MGYDPFKEYNRLDIGDALGEMDHRMLNYRSDSKHAEDRDLSKHPVLKAYADIKAERRAAGYVKPTPPRKRRRNGVPWVGEVG